MSGRGDLTRLAALLSTIYLDYMVKVSGRSDIHVDLARKFPLPRNHRLDFAMALRYLRLNCLTADFGPLWEELFSPEWKADAWALPHATVDLGDVDADWSMATPLRRDVDRRLALVEIDALAALMLGLSAEQLCAMYRTQFAVLRKYEHAMVFDAEGRKICKHHQSAGYRQSTLQARAKGGDLPSEWKSIWKLVEAHEDDPGSVDWQGHYTPPFHHPDREQEMTTAYRTFESRLERGAG